MNILGLMEIFLLMEIFHLSEIFPFIVKIQNIGKSILELICLFEGFPYLKISLYGNFFEGHFGLLHHQC